MTHANIDARYHASQKGRISQVPDCPRVSSGFYRAALICLAVQAVFIACCFAFGFWLTVGWTAVTVLTVFLMVASGSGVVAERGRKLGKDVCR